MKFIPLLIFFSLMCSADTGPANHMPARKAAAVPLVETEEEQFTVKLKKLRKAKKKKKLPVASVSL